MNRERGQATVELALLLPVLALVTLIVVQVGLVARDRVALTHVAREASRAAVVDPSAAAARRAAVGASSLDPRRLRVDVRTGGGAGGRVTVVVSYRSPTDVPLIGALVGDVTFTERLVGQVER